MSDSVTNKFQTESRFIAVSGSTDDLKALESNLKAFETYGNIQSTMITLKIRANIMPTTCD